MNFKLGLIAMKILALIMVVGCLQVSAAGFGQKISISMQDVPLERVFSEIKKQAGVSFTYMESTLADAKKVTIHISNATIKQALDSCLKGQNLSYMIIDNTVVIRTSSVKRDELLQVLNIVIKGVLVNQKKVPVSGATVTVKGTKIATSTNEKGEFELSNVPENATLVFTGTDIETFETKVSGRTFLSLTAQTKISQIEDIKIITTGFQNIEKRNLIGDIDVVAGDELKEMPSNGSFEKSLSGRVAGVYVRSNSGRPGESGTVQIRGINTLTGNREPLWILDGMPLPTGEVSSNVNELLTRGLGNIPPEDIESITILKDATASAIYGSRAANGVIVITTKQGHSGKDYLSYSGRYSISEAPQNKFNFMNTPEKIDFERSIFSDFKDGYGGRVVGILNSVEKGNITESEGENQIELLSKTNTDWMKVIMQNAATQSHVLSLSGGTNKTQYYGSLNYSKSDGVLKTNKYENAGLNMKLSNFVRKNLLVRLNLYGTVKKNIEGQSAIDPFTYATFANPYEKPYNEDGSYAPDLTYVLTSADVTDPYSGYDHFNILNELKNNTKTDYYGNIRGQLGIEYKFLKYFRYTGTGVFNYSTVHSMDESAPGTYRSKINNWMRFVFPGIYTSGIPDSYNNGYLRESNARATDFTVRNTLEFNRSINKSFVQALVAEEFGGATNYQFYNLDPVYFPESRVAGYPDMYSYFPSTRLNLKALGGTGYTQQKSASFISSVSYSYDNRYVLNASFRSDGVSILGNANQFTPLWSAGIQWNVHNESFLKNSETISRLVLHLGYGYTGSINSHGIFPFSYYNVNTSGSTYDGILYANSITYGNPVLKWEKKQNKDAGIELSLFRGRFNAEFNYYNETVTNLLDQVQVPASSGRNSTFENASSLRNIGYELALRAEVIRSKNFMWEVRGNISSYKNKVLATYNSSIPSQGQTELNFDTKFVKGYPVDSWFGLKYAGVDPNTGHVMAWARKQLQNLKDGNIFYTYEDTKIDITTTSYSDIITNYRPYYLGSKQPDFYGGFQNRLTYKNWEAFIAFSFASGNKILGFNERYSTPDARSSDARISRLNRLKVNTNRWRSPGDITDIPVYFLYSNAFNSVFTDYDLESGSYLKCQSISLSYRLPKILIGNFGLNNTRIGLAATNLFTLSTYSGIDPETQTAFGYPNTKMYSVSLEIGL